jgi:hypothetical protein
MNINIERVTPPKGFNNSAKEISTMTKAISEALRDLGFKVPNGAFRIDV